MSIVLLICFGRKNWLFLKDARSKVKTWQEITTLHNLTLSMLGISDMSLHEDMQKLKLGGDVGS